MSLALDPAAEQRIQQPQIARGPYREPAELINRALDLLESQAESQQDWALRNTLSEFVSEPCLVNHLGNHTPQYTRSMLDF